MKLLRTMGKIERCFATLLGLVLKENLASVTSKQIRLISVTSLQPYK